MGRVNEEDDELLPKRDANYTALTPLSFLQRSAAVYPDKISIIYHERRFTWAQTLQRCRCLASALIKHSIAAGDTVAVVAPNVPAMYEVHFGVPMAAAVLNCINIRLDARTVAFLLQHSRAKAVLVDEEFFPLVTEALYINAQKQESSHLRPFLVLIRDEYNTKQLRQSPNVRRKSVVDEVMDYEEFLLQGDPGFQWKPPADEWESISVCYTSGTTASPKGVVMSHRGAYLAALSNCLVWEMKHSTVYLWTLPLFHCNGWCLAWALAALAGTNVCLRQVIPKHIFSAIADEGVNHFCGAPTVLNMLINAEPHERVPFKAGVKVMTAGAAPPIAVLAKMEEQGFEITHTYGLTETYGPSTICAWKKEWDELPLADRAGLKARQGVAYIALEGLDIVDPETMIPVPADGSTMGEIVMQGNMVMKGYLRNPEASRQSFQGGWFHSGDLGLKHPDGYIEVKDRSKDIIISGGENISSIEVESALYRHPFVLEASVVARPDDEWGESPCAFITLKQLKGAECVTQEDIIKFCRSSLPHFMVPRSVVFGSLPKTATGKIQKYVLRSKAKALGTLPKSSRSRL